MTERLRARRAVRTLADVHPVDAAFVVVALVAFVYLLQLARSATFLDDDWVFVGSRELWSFDSWMRPHNEHWSLVPVVLFRAVFAVVGLHSYLPYLALLLALHVIVAAGLYRLMSVVVGRLEGLAAATVLLVLGTAHENIFWAFQIGFLGSAAAGLWAIECLRRPGTLRRDTIAAILLALSVASSGIGIPFLVAAVVLVCVQPLSRSRSAAVVGPALLYAAWFVAYGRAATGTVDWGQLTALPLFVLEGASRAISSVTGLPTDAGRFIFLVVAGTTVVQVLRGRVTAPLAVASVSGTAVLYAIIGLSRGGPLGVEAVYAPRYVTFGALFALIAAGALLGPATGRGAAIGRVALLGPVLLVALASNLDVLNEAADRYTHEANRTRATISALERYQGTPAMAVASGAPLPPDLLRATLARHGSPVRDDIRPEVVPAIDPVDADLALVALVRPAFVVEIVDHVELGTSAPVTAGEYNTAAQRDGSCVRMTALGADSQIWSVVSGGSTWVVEGLAAGDLGVYLYREAPPQEASAIHTTTVIGQRIRIAVPDLGPEVAWQLRLKIPPGTEGAKWCSATS